MRKKVIGMKRKLQHWTLILLLGSMFWFGWQNRVMAIAQLPSADTRHILERLSFGITSEQMQQAEDLGIEAYIENQLNPKLVSESPVLIDYLKQLDFIDLKPVEIQKKEVALRQQLKNPKISSQRQIEIEEQLSDIRRNVSNEAVNSHLARAIYSNRQLQEVMVDFWFNHFNVYIDKGPIKFWINDYESQIRNHAFGRFQDLLTMTAKHPAMQVYLDNKFNIAPNSSNGLKNKRGLNENYARELMELHTLGVDGGYTQDDVIVLARIFTGWSASIYNKEVEKRGFIFYQDRHDSQDKIFLGHQISAGGIEEGELALDILANHPATARNISYKLAQYFVADEPPSSLVDLLTQKFLDSEGDIKVVLNTLIHSSEFNDPQYYKQKFKTPYQYLVSLVRMAEIERPNTKRIQGMLTKLSMPVYKCSAPTGYKNTRSAWLNPQAMLQRTSFAMAIARKSLNEDYQIKPQQLETNLGETSQHTKQVISKSPQSLRSALMMGSPEAMYR